MSIIFPFTGSRKLTYDEKIERFNVRRSAKPDKNGCIRWNGKFNPSGYGVFALFVGEEHFGLAHRIAFFLKDKNFDRDKCVCHTCDKPYCVNIDHLFLGTHEENMKDMMKKGRSRKIKFTREESEGILKMRYDGLSYEKIANFYDTSIQTIIRFINDHADKTRIKQKRKPSIPFTNEQKEKIAHMRFVLGMKLRDISTELGLNYNSVTTFTTRERNKRFV